MAHDDLSSLDVETLRHLGGVRDTCTAALTCVAHGLHVPCEQCEVEDLTAAACRTCGGRTDASVVTAGEHACASVAQFTATGRIAFADEARAALLRQAAERARGEATAPPVDDGREARPRRLGPAILFASALLGLVLVLAPLVDRALTTVWSPSVTRDSAPRPASAPVAARPASAAEYLVTASGRGPTVYEAQRDAAWQAQREVLQRLVATGSIPRTDPLATDRTAPALHGFVTRFVPTALVQSAEGYVVTARVGISGTRIDEAVAQRTSVQTPADLRRQRGQAVASLLRHFPLGALDVTIESLGVVPDDVDLTDVTLRVTVAPEFMRNLWQGLQALGASSATSFSPAGHSLVVCLETDPRGAAASWTGPSYHGPAECWRALDVDMDLDLVRGFRGDASAPAWHRARQDFSIRLAPSTITHTADGVFAASLQDADQAPGDTPDDGAGEVFQWFHDSVTDSSFIGVSTATRWVRVRVPTSLVRAHAIPMELLPVVVPIGRYRDEGPRDLLRRVIPSLSPFEDHLTTVVNDPSFLERLWLSFAPLEPVSSGQ